MNLFCVQHDPVLAARDNCNDHCKKMIVESAQMLANCFSLETLKLAPPAKTGTPREYSYFNHPVSKFVRQTQGNMMWTVNYALTLEEERLKLGWKPHFTISFIQWVKDNLHLSYVPAGNLTEFAIAISPEMNCRKSFRNFDNLDRITQYLLYYIFDKPFADWTGRTVPSWFKPIKSNNDLNELINHDRVH